MEADHYENLPIARAGADIAGRHTGLADFRAGLDAVASGRMAPVHSLLFGKLAGVVAQYKLPLALRRPGRARDMAVPARQRVRHFD